MGILLFHFQGVLPVDGFIFPSLCVVCCLCGLYKTYRELELVRIGHLATHFAVHGYVCIDGTRPIRKRKVWHQLLCNHFVACWQKHYPEIDLHQSETWPCDPSGKTYQDNITDTIAGTPLLYTENYEAQAVLCYFLSSRLKRVSFGVQTHWRLKFLIDPLWAIGFSSGPNEDECIVLHGDDQAWHIVNWPSCGLSRTEPVTDGGHIDSGPGGVFTRGLPPPLRMSVSTPILSFPSSESHIVHCALLSLLLHQTAILYYCETPGLLGPAQGMTGIVSSSHVILLEALRQRLTTAVVSPSRDTFDTPAIAWEDLDCTGGGIRMGLKRWSGTPAALSRLVQPEIGEGQAVLCMGLVVHTAMKPVLPMCSADTDSDGRGQLLPRVIQNAKSYVRKRSRSVNNEGVTLAENACHLYLLLKAQAASSLAWELLTDPYELHTRLIPQRSNEEIRNMKMETDTLVKIFSICT